MPSVRRSISGARRQIRLEIFHAARGHRAYQKAEAPNVARVPDSLSGVTLHRLRHGLLLGKFPSLPFPPLVRQGKWRVGRSQVVLQLVHGLCAKPLSPFF
jgi:hypothetical protein